MRVKTNGNHKKVSASKQVTPPPAQAEIRICRTLSNTTLSTNRFSSLDSLDDEGKISASDDESDSKDLLTPSGKRFLRKKLVKPTTKAKQMQWHSVAAGRGNCGCGKRGGLD